MDGMLGLILSFILVSQLEFNAYILGAALVAQLPDALQFVYWRVRREPLTSLQKFHIWIHTKNKMRNMKWVSISAQALFILLVTASFWANSYPLAQLFR